jgi:hypothetical protein
MTEAEALAKDPLAVRADWSFELRWVDDGPDEPREPMPRRWPV